MDSIVLSPKELLVLASKMGAKSFYGIQDPFRGMTRNEIRTELPGIQLQLEKKGLATLGFDDSFTLTPLCEEIIPTCALCDQYIAVDSIAFGNVQPKTLLYFRNGMSVALHKSEPGLELRKVSSDEATTFLMSLGFSNCANIAEETSCFKFSQSLLMKARDMEFQEALNAFEKNGCPPPISEVLVLGLHQKCEYCSLIAVDLKKHDFKNLICIITQDRSLRLALGEEDDIWQATWVSKDTIHHEIESVIKGYSTR